MGVIKGLTFFSACCENPGPSKTKVGSKRNWNVANQADTLDPALKCAVKKDTDKHVPPSVGRLLKVFDLQ